MKLYFIRHGQTDWNLSGKIQGSFDIQLNAKGIEQAEELGRTMYNKYNVSKIYTSTQQRAITTAQILSQIIQVEYTPFKGLEEINLGEWEGLTWQEVKETHPIEYEIWYHNRRYTKVPNGESYQDMLRRVLNALQSILSIEKDNLAIVTHGAVIMCLQCFLTDTPFENMTKFKVDNTFIAEIDSELIQAKLLDIF